MPGLTVRYQRRAKTSTRSSRGSLPSTTPGSTNAVSRTSSSRNTSWQDASASHSSNHRVVLIARLRHCDSDGWSSPSVLGANGIPGRSSCGQARTCPRVVGRLRVRPCVILRRRRCGCGSAAVGVPQGDGGQSEEHEVGEAELGALEGGVCRAWDALGEELPMRMQARGVAAHIQRGNEVGPRRMATVIHREAVSQQVRRRNGGGGGAGGPGAGRGRGAGRRRDGAGRSVRRAGRPRPGGWWRREASRRGSRR